MMTIEEQRKYIQEQRAKGTPDAQILSNIKRVEQQAPAENPQRSGWGEVVPTAFAVGGGILGGIGGTAVAPGVGTVGGGIAGATAGGAIGEAIQQRIEKGFGQREKMNPGQIAAQGVISGTLEATGGIFAKAVKPVFNVTKPTLVKVVSKLSGYADDVVDAALRRTPGAIQGVQQGEKALMDIVQKTSAGISNFAKQTLKESNDAIATFTKRSVTGALPGTKANLLRDSAKFGSRVVSDLRSQFNIGVDKTGNLLFDRAKNISNIVSGGDRSAIQSAYNAIQSIAKNPDIKNIDSVLERLIVLRSKTPVGSPTGAETRAIIGNMSDSVLNWIKSIPAGYGKGYAAYSKFLEQNLPKRIMINDAKEIFGGSSNLTPKETSQISKRLLQLYNTGNLAQREFAGEVGKTIGQDITGTAAGTLLKTGDQMSVRAPNLTTRGVFTKVAESVPRSVVKNYVATGNIVGELPQNIKTLAKLLGISEKVLLNELVNVSANKTTQ